MKSKQPTNEPFVRGEDTKSTKNLGAGLGGAGQGNVETLFAPWANNKHVSIRIHNLQIESFTY